MNTSELFKLLTNKLSFIIIICTLAWSLLDLNSRLLINSTVYQKKAIDFKPSTVIIPQISLDTYEELNKVYRQYARDVEVDTNDSGMNLRDQAKQQGILDSLYVDDSKIMLKAIISTDLDSENKNAIVGDEKAPIAMSALISVINIKSGKEKMEKFTQHSQVYGYHLSIENNTQVVLTKMNDQAIQKIVLVMYK